MSTKVRILSSDTPHLKLLEQRAEQGRQEVLELRNKVQELSTQIWNQYQRMCETNAESICLELGIEKLKSVIVDETAMKINLRTQILASLGCDLADEGCIEAITTSEVPQNSVCPQGELSQGSESSAPSKSPSCIQKEINDEEFNALPDTINCLQEDEELRTPLKFPSCLPEGLEEVELTTLLAIQCTELQKMAGSLSDASLFQQCTRLCDLAYKMK
ncbi:uncharacterized protein C8R40DRAFT_1069447 [Lentinula edodes]|uniref:uncharacterized protein n=1 Tax=Lentinula edodes TaxID=5353 RepID=UPI001E8D7C83|nr:uncharacterized protein C8R40DRAFT_1069447 [Lentinula edodes]KAH7875431.1 hypothetical protein C8R40DRAFT_1069447 [Lentinula edodes]